MTPLKRNWALWAILGFFLIMAGYRGVMSASKSRAAARAAEEEWDQRHHPGKEYYYTRQTR